MEVTIILKVDYFHTCILSRGYGCYGE